MLTAIADPTRRRIIELLARADESVTTVTSRCRVSQPAMSRHLRVLRESGIVTSHSRGQRRIYSLDQHSLGELDDWITHLRHTWASRLDAIAAEATHPPTAQRTAKPLHQQQEETKT